MKRWIVTLVGAASLALVAAGCSGSSGGSGGDGTSSASGDGAATTEAVAEFNDADVAFAQGMIPHHQQAVEMADLAETRAESQEVKALAAQIRDAQDPEIEQMSAWLEEWGEPVESTDSGMDDGEMGGMTMDGMMTDAQMTDLEGASGAAFDTMFLEMMIDHHGGAIGMAKMEIADGSNPDAIALAEAIASAQEAEIETMQALLDEK